MTKKEQFRYIDEFLEAFKRSSYDLGKALMLLGTPDCDLDWYAEILEKNTDLHNSLRKMIRYACGLEETPRRRNYKRLKAVLDGKQGCLKEENLA